MSAAASFNSATRHLAQKHMVLHIYPVPLSLACCYPQRRGYRVSCLRDQTGKLVLAHFALPDTSCLSQKPKSCHTNVSAVRTMWAPLYIFLLLAITLAELAIASVIPAANESLVIPRAFGVRRPATSNDPNNPNAAAQLRGPWPNQRLLYRYENDDSRQALSTAFEDAWQVWVGQGLGLSKREDTGVRGVLKISRSKTGRTVTGVGYQPGKAIEMTINTEIDHGHRDLTTVIAHEMGHALGLYHEHQKPVASSKINIKFENFADWDDSVNEAKARGRSADDLKNDRNLMEQVGAACYEVVPYDAVDARQYFQDNDNDIDWDSIMLYGSTFGAKEVDGKKKSVMKKKGMLRPSSSFQAARVPSKRDVTFVNNLHDVQ